MWSEYFQEQAAQVQKATLSVTNCHFLCATLSELDVLMASVGRLQSCPTVRFRVKTPISFPRRHAG
jgi:hypothetical protein